MTVRSRGKTRRRALAPVLVSLVSVVIAGGSAERRACAQNAGAAAEAQALFDEGRKLMNKADFAHACPKFAASQQADPAAGTLLNLANCYEKNGQTASAWVTFKDAAAAAHASNHKDWQKSATEHVVKLEASLSRLTLRLAPGQSEAQLTIRRDETAVSSALLGTAIPVDPGTHTVDATAPGKKPFHVRVEIAAGGQREEIVIPALEDRPAEGVVAATGAIRDRPRRRTATRAQPGATAEVSGPWGSCSAERASPAASPER